MGTSSDDIIGTTSAELDTLIVASIHTLKRGHKKCVNEEVS